jgi:hypothetical protein
MFKFTSLVTDDERVVLNRVYNMAQDMVNDLTNIAGPTPLEGFRPMIKDELAKYALDIERIRIRLGKILNGTAGF